MSFGDHLEELRSCLILALGGVCVASVLCLIFGKEILEVICRPLYRVQHDNGLPSQLQVLSPTAAFTAYLKIGILSGLILAAPWVLYQFWRFVATGLYARERRFVRFVAPATFGLFALGVAFLYFVVLPIVLHFFIRFNHSFDLPAFAASGPADTSQSTDGSPSPGSSGGSLPIPIVTDDPAASKPGDVWFNSRTRRLIVHAEDGLWSQQLIQGAAPASMQSLFAVDFYVSFVLVLALAFGIAFETPMVVFFLSLTGIVPASTMGRARRYVILGVVVSAAIMTPPDIISQLLLAIPMYLLFEVGLVAARIVERKERAA